MQSFMRSTIVKLSVVAVLFIVPRVSGAQTVAQQGQPRTTQDASNVAKQTFNALGGQRAWMQISSISSTATITSNVSPTRTIVWTDDWSSGMLNSLRSVANGGDSSSGRPISQTFTANGTSVTVPKQSDYSILAISAPAVALSLGLSNGHCQFYPESDNLHAAFSTHAVPFGQLAFAQACSVAANGESVLHWRVNASTFIPISVSIPEKAFGSNTYTHKLVTYESFATIGSASIPSKVTLTSAGTITQQVEFSGIATNQASLSTSK